MENKTRSTESEMNIWMRLTTFVAAHFLITGGALAIAQAAG